MGIMDRYIIRQFSRIFLMTFACLFGIYVIAEFVTNLTEFMRYRNDTDDFGMAVLGYYGARVPLFFELAGGIVALLAAVLVVANMQRFQELTALQAAGICRWRIVKPLFLSAVTISVLGVANRELLLPQVRDRLITNIRDLASQQRRSFDPRYDHATDILFDGDSVHIELGQIHQPRLRLPFNWSATGMTISGKLATFREASTMLPAGYLITEVEEPLDGVASIILDGRPLLLSPHDTPWLEQRQCFVVSNLQPSEMRGNYRWQQYGSTTQLVADIQEASLYRSDGLRVTLHTRFVKPFLDVALLFLGLPIAMATQRRPIVSGAAKCVLLVSVVSLVTLSSQAMGIQAMISPELAAWLPLMCVVPIAVLMSDTLAR